MKMETEMRVMKPQAKECLEEPELEETMLRVSPRTFGDRAAPPAPNCRLMASRTENINFCCFKPPSL